MFGWILRSVALFVGMRLLRSLFGNNNNRDQRRRDPLQRQRQQRHPAR